MKEAIDDDLEAASLVVALAVSGTTPSRSVFSSEQMARIRTAEKEATERLRPVLATRKYPRSKTTYVRRLTLKAAKRDGDTSSGNKQ